MAVAPAMEDRLLRLETAVANLQRQVASLERRVGTDAVALDEPEGTDSLFPVAFPRVAFGDTAVLLSVVGRSLVVLGGAFLLRAITDARLVSPAVGVACGLAYACVWLWTADRSAAAHRVSAIFHALVTTTIAFPLLWEATVKFEVLTPAAAAGALAVAIAVLIAVSLRQRVQWIAWMAAAGGIVTSIALLAATSVLVPFALLMIAFGVATLWIGYAFDWTMLRWPVAAAADFLAVGVTLRVSARDAAEPALVAVALQLLLLNAYVGSIAIRTLVRARDVNAFEVVQTLAVLTVGFGGAVYVAHFTGAGVVPLAVVNLAAGAAAYVVAWMFLSAQQALTRNFYFYTSLALVLVIVSGPLLLAGSALALLFAALALTATIVSHREQRGTLAWHALLYLLAACTVADVWTDASSALLGSAAAAWPSYDAGALLVSVTAAACWAVSAAGARGVAAFAVPRALFAAIAIWSLSGWLVGAVVPPLCGTPGAGADAGAVATVRTITIAAAALALAWIALRSRAREAVWLTYALLLAGAAKLVAEDLPTSKPATLFIALAFYGAALIVASRLGRPRVASH